MTRCSRPAATRRSCGYTGTNKALAITTDCTPRYCYADPYEGGKQAVAEAYRNLCAVGAKPLAITNCLNFGNPQRPEIMAQIVGCLEGMSEACIALDMPIVSGNVSLYNESKATGGGSAILPTPAIGAVGLIDDWRKAVGIGLKQPGLLVRVLGARTTGTHLGQSLWLRDAAGAEVGLPPKIDLVLERRVGDLVRSLISDGLLAAVHDLSDGGLVVAVSEMVLAGSVGTRCVTDGVSGISLAAQLFGEDQARYAVAIEKRNWDEVADRADAAGVPFYECGLTGGEGIEIVIEERDWKERHIPLATLRAAHEGFFPALMDA